MYAWLTSLMEPHDADGLTLVPPIELQSGAPNIWPVVALRNIYILPGVPSLFRRKFVDIRDRFRTEPVVTARVYVDDDEGAIAGDLDAVVAAYPSVRIGSYPRFAEQDFRVLVTFEGHDAAAVGGAYQQLVDRIGARFVRGEPPAT